MYRAKPSHVAQNTYLNIAITFGIYGKTVKVDPLFKTPP